MVKRQRLLLTNPRSGLEENLFPLSLPKLGDLPGVCSGLENLTIAQSLEIEGEFGDCHAPVRVADGFAVGQDPLRE
jgi:hypothetical protein